MAAKKKTQAKKEQDGGQKWHDGIPALVRSLAGRSTKGLTDQEVADACGVVVRTVHRWKIDHPEFLKALLETKAIMDARVESSLYQRALGYPYKEVEITIEGGREIKRVERDKALPPDIPAIKLWLTNRDPERWRDKMDLEHSGKIEVEDARATLLARISALAPEGNQEQ